VNRRTAARAFAVAAALAMVTWPAAEARADERVAACADAAERGQELRASHQLVAARRSFVACAQRDCPVAIRDSCTEWLADLDRRAPSIVVGAKDENGRDVRDVVVTLDGSPLPATVTTTAFAVDPGALALRCEAPGHEPVTEDVVLREGEPLRVISLTLHTTASARLDARAPGAAAARPFPVVPVALGAASVLALGVFGVFGVTAANDYRALDRECAPECPSSRVDGVRTRFLVADVALVVGVVTGVAGAAVWLFDRPAPRSASR
jgi:hypothetical protein